MAHSNIYPLVSVIVPVYGVEKYIGKCIQTVIDQTYDNIELVIVNDCTKDNSMSIVDNVLSNKCNSKKVRIINHEVNKGLSAARQTGIESSTGEYLMHLDSDDFLELNAIELLVSCLNDNGSEIAVGGTIHEYNDKNLIDLRAVTGLYTADKESYLKGVITQDIPNSIWGKLIKTSLYKDNAIKCIEEICYAEDYAVLPKLIFCSQKISFVPKPLYHYTHYNVGSYTNNYKWKNITDCFRAFEEIKGYFLSYPEYDTSIRVAHLKQSAWAIRQQISNKKDFRALKTLVDPLEYRNGDLSKLALNHAIIVWLYVRGFVKLLNMYIQLSGTLIKKRKK